MDYKMISVIRMCFVRHLPSIIMTRGELVSDNQKEYLGRPYHLQASQEWSGQYSNNSSMGVKLTSLNQTGAMSARPGRCGLHPEMTHFLPKAANASVSVNVNEDGIPSD